jgi:phosphoribosylformimino-5-aminoimidazole carboxamide ribotide isomerase
MIMEIIPAIDLIDAKCVRLSQGDYNRKTIYNEDPLEVARQFEANGIRRLHLVDLDGAKAEHIVNYNVLEKIATKTSLIIDFGGGLKTDEDLRVAFQCGASMITGGSIAVRSPEVFESWINRYGGDKIILGADVKGEKIAVTGWTEETDNQLMPFLDGYIRKGIKKVICTDIGKDGMMQGPSTDLYRKILAAYPGLHLVASGGVSSMHDLEVLAEAGLPAVIIGKALYEGLITLKELSPYLSLAEENEISL